MPASSEDGENPARDRHDEPVLVTLRSLGSEAIPGEGAKRPNGSTPADALIGQDDQPPGKLDLQKGEQDPPFSADPL